MSELKLYLDNSLTGAHDFDAAQPVFRGNLGLSYGTSFERVSLGGSAQFSGLGQPDFGGYARFSGATPFGIPRVTLDYNFNQNTLELEGAFLVPGGLFSMGIDAMAVGPSLAVKRQPGGDYGVVAGLMLTFNIKPFNRW